MTKGFVRKTPARGTAISEVAAGMMINARDKTPSSRGGYNRGKELVNLDDLRSGAIHQDSDDHSPVEEYVENRGSDSSSSDEEVKRKSKKSKKFKKKKTMKNRKQSASDSSRDGSEEEDTNGDLWVERTCIDKHMVGPEAPLTHLSQDDKPLE
ncbi:NF-kappa-B-activating protein isoform X3 [Oncorhynchus tshawytscha]|nr:NF-kappa-B-activating protein isoform X3 [Oncorhynchus tshawytscha]